jgi:primosomal protein N' (replication factor Y)
MCYGLIVTKFRKKHALHAHLDKINRGEAQLIVGTQMLAKGHHFPKLTLVVVVDADNGFYNQDFRAIERLGQLLIQVAGRAGRELEAGHVVIQTHVPQHPLLNLLVQQGYGPFAEALLNLRKQASLPPYSYMAMLRAQSKTMSSVLHFFTDHQTKAASNRHSTPRSCARASRSQSQSSSDAIIIAIPLTQSPRTRPENHVRGNFDA